MMSRTNQWIAIALVAVLAILVGGWFLVVNPKHQHADELNSQADSAQQQVQSLRTQLATLAMEKERLPAAKAKIAAFTKKIPADAAVPSLVRLLNVAEKSSGVSITAITPGAATAYVAPGSAVTATTTTATTTSDSGLMQIPVSLTVAGEYFQLEQFVSSLEQLQRRFLVTGYALTPAKDGGAASTTTTTTTSSDKNALSLDVTGLVFEAPSGASATSSAAPPTTAGGPKTSATTSSTN